MRSIVALLLLSTFVLVSLATFRIQQASAAPKVGVAGASTTVPDAKPITESTASSNVSRSMVIVSSLTVFVLAVFIGFEVIGKVPPTLHTPLMSGSNAISGITVVGAIVIAGFKDFGLGSVLGMIAVVLAMINVVGGFAVTHRMLLMFKKR